MEAESKQDPPYTGMTARERIVLVLKGMCMGLADVVPGVSGGTMALVLGIYTRLINAIKSVDLRFVKPFFRALKGGFRREAREDLMQAVREAHLPWLATLAIGIGGALVVGSRFIPTLMERHPEIMFAFFFGLVLASVSAPARMIERFGAVEIGLIVVMAVGGFFSVAESMSPPTTYVAVTAADVEDGGQTLKSLAEAGPSALPPEGIYYDEKNAELQAAVPLDEATRGLDPKDKTNPYNTLVVPAGTTVQVPTPALWFVFFAGFIAICAMVLPGVSGSFILLVLGVYYFILNALKGFIKTSAGLELPVNQATFVIIFCIGALMGLVVMTRVLSYLLERAPAPTMAALIGLMLGSLRAIWPFKARVDGSSTMTNVAPSTEVFGSSVVYGSAAAFVVGVVLVLGLTWVASRRDEAAPPDEAPAP